VALLLAALAVIALGAGLGSASGLLRWVGGFRGIWLHVAAASRWCRWWSGTCSRVRRTPQDRPVRAHPAAGGHARRGRRRRLCRHHRGGPRRRAAGREPALHRLLEAGSFDPAAMPTTSWIGDVAPEVDPATWRLVVADADGERELSLESSPATTRACARPSTAPAAGTPTRTGRACRSRRR
jgi:hypothetical protein